MRFGPVGFFASHNGTAVLWAGGQHPLRGVVRAAPAILRTDPVIFFTLIEHGSFLSTLLPPRRCLEPMGLSLSHANLLWSCGDGLLIVLTQAAAFYCCATALSAVETPPAPRPPSHKLGVVVVRWVFLAAVPPIRPAYSGHGATFRPGPRRRGRRCFGVFLPSAIFGNLLTWACGRGVSCSWVGLEVGLAGSF